MLFIKLGHNLDVIYYKVMVQQLLLIQRLLLLSDFFVYFNWMLQSRDQPNLVNEEREEDLESCDD